jgi:hypothetical protein
MMQKADGLDRDILYRSKMWRTGRDRRAEKKEKRMLRLGYMRGKGSRLTPLEIGFGRVKHLMLRLRLSHVADGIIFSSLEVKITYAVKSPVSPCQHKRLCGALDRSLMLPTLIYYWYAEAIGSQVGECLSLVFFFANQVPGGEDWGKACFYTGKREDGGGRQW